MTTHDDLKALAQQRFDKADFEPLNAHDIVWRSTDIPVIVDTLMDAVRPVARPGARIIELGFGHGEVLGEMRSRFPDCSFYGLDLSKRYTAIARERMGAAAVFTLGDMERLPYSDASFDAVVTCWTLYFMNDLDAALREMRRVLRPGGIFVAATNARDHMHEYTELAATAVRDALGREMSPDIDVRFDVDTGGDAVRRCFPDTTLREWHGMLTLTTLAEVESLWPTYGDWSVSEADTPAVLDALRQHAAQILGRVGVVSFRRHGGAFIASV